MNKCCENQITPFCGTCGANLKANSLLGLVEELGGRKKKAEGTLRNWTARSTKPFANEAEGKKVKRAVVRNEARVKQLNGWIELVIEVGH